jgi:hypothetical protein
LILFDPVWDHASAAHLTVLLKSCCPGSFRAKRSFSMRVHLDKKPPDGAAIGFFVFTLLIPFALAILLSSAKGFF